MRCCRTIGVIVGLTYVGLFAGGVMAQEQQPPSVPPRPVKTVPSPPNGIEVIGSREFGGASFNVPGNVQVVVDNRTTGSIKVTGWDREVISVRAVSERGDEVVIVERKTDGRDSLVFLKADYADLESNDRTARVDLPPLGNDGPIQIHLAVSLPRKANISSIRVIRSNVEVENVDTPLVVSGSQSSIVLRHVGPVEVHTRSGNIEIEDARGLVNVTTSTGAIHLLSPKSEVRALSIVGPIEIRCARGHVDVGNTNAPIDIYDSSGDVDAVAANSSVRFIGALQEGHRYFSKSMSGRVEMILPANTRGFKASLSSYSGIVESDFPLTNRQPQGNAHAAKLGDKESTRRMNGQYGNSKTEIILDSFEGLVRVTKNSSQTTATCK